MALYFFQRLGPLSMFYHHLQVLGAHGNYVHMLCIDGSNACKHFLGASPHGVGVQHPLAHFSSFISSLAM